MSERPGLGRVTRFESLDTSTVEIETACAKARVYGISPTTIRFRLQMGDWSDDDVSYSIENPFPSVDLTVQEDANAHEITVSAGQVALRIDTSELAVSVLGAEGAVLSEGLPVLWKEECLWDQRALREQEDVYGLGERVTPLGRRGYATYNWNVDDPRPHNENTAAMYSSFPFAICTGASLAPWGYFMDSPYRSDFKAGEYAWDLFEARSYSKELNIYFIAGDTVAKVLNGYVALTGTHPMPPIWALGYHQCRWSYMSTKDAAEVANTLRAKKIPCDVMWYDIDYMDDFRVFTFDKERFGDVKKHFKEMAKRGFRKVTIVDPGVKVDPKGVYDVHDEGTERGFFLKTPEGEDYVGKVWPGGTKFPDFTKPEVAKWWGDLHKRYYDVGVDAFWNDMNEPADHSNKSISGTAGTVPNEVPVYDGGRNSTMEKIHNVYATFEAKATTEGQLRLRPNDRPFLLTRAAYCGIQKYSAKWCGDNFSSWAHLKASIAQVLNLGMSGVGYAGCDVGGFSGQCTPEMLARWTQLGAFYPFFRNHSSRGSNRQEPWLFGQEVEDICRKAIELRYHLLPYYYQLFHEMHTTGAPIMRPLFWHYPQDPKTYSLVDQFMVGPHLLAAPVVERGARERMVYLPEGVWYDYVRGTRYEGGQSYLIEAQLEDIPLFVKAGALIPVMEVIQTTADYDRSTLTIEYVAGEECTMDYYEDDMLSNAYREGESCVSTVRCDDSGWEVSFASESKIKQVRTRLFAQATEASAGAEHNIWVEASAARNGDAASGSW